MPYQVRGVRPGALALTRAWIRSARTRSGSGISAIFASTSASGSVLPRAPRRPAFSSRARSFIAARSSSVKPADVFATDCFRSAISTHLPGLLVDVHGLDASGALVARTSRFLTTYYFRPASRCFLLPGTSLLGASAGDEDGRAGEEPPAQRAPLLPHPFLAFRPLRLHQVDQHEPGGHQLPDPVAEGAVLLDVGGRAGGVVLHVRAPVEVRVHGHQPTLGRVVQEDPPDRVG